MDARALRSRSLKIWIGLVAAACAAWATPALADDACVQSSPRTARPGEVTLRCVVIKSRAPRPLAAVEVARVSTQKAIPLRAFSPIGRIETAARRAPF